MSWNFARFHEIQFQTEPESFSFLTKFFLSRCQYQNKQDLKKSVTASIWLFCLFFKLPFFYFLFFKFLFFTSFSFLLLLYFLFTFQVLCTLLSKSYFIFFSFSKLLPLSDTIWSDPTRSDFAFSILSFLLGGDGEIHQTNTRHVWTCLDLS